MIKGSKLIKAGAVTLGVMALTAFNSRADIAGEIRSLSEEGDYKSAIRYAEESIPLASEGEKGAIYQALGEALYNQPGSRRESLLSFEEAKDRGIPESYLYLGRLAMLDFDFPAAQRMFGEYCTRMRKAKREIDPDIDYDEADAREGKRQFDRMQEIVVIDAVKVGRKDFFRHLRLPLSAGRVVASAELPLDLDGKDSGPAGFISESGDFMLWSEADETSGLYRLMEATRLADGSVSQPHAAPESLGQEGDVINPFMLGDGTTLYFASNGENSVGGYDIFVATRDPQTGEYLQPVNVGIPFNSSADEYVMAIDEENGVGWWATDRHYLPDDMIMLYVYVLPEERINLRADDEEKRLRARLEDIRLTWTPPESVAEDPDGDDESDDDPEDEDAVGATATGEIKDPALLARQYSALAAEIRKITPGQKPRRHDCVIPMGNGRYVYSADDVATPEQKELVEQYVKESRTLGEEKARLSAFRKDYARQSSRALSGDISRLEEEIEKRENALTSILSELYRTLLKHE